MVTSGLLPEHFVQLLALVANGDDGAFRTLHQASRPQLAARAHRIVRCAAATEDVLQESFTAIWHHATRFERTHAAPMTWMSTIVRNKALDHLRAERFRNHCSLDDVDQLTLEGHDPSGGPDGFLERFQRDKMIGRGVSLLASPQRQAIELAFFHDLSYPEVAREMMIPLGTVKTWLRRSCIQLRTTCCDNSLLTRFPNPPTVAPT